MLTYISLLKNPMYSLKHGMIFIVFFSVLTAWDSPSFARKIGADVHMPHIRAVARSCVGNWESQECLAAVSRSALDLAARYAEELSNAGHDFAIELIKEHCAAGTAAAEGEYPAYAMKSAWTECANIMSDISEATGLNPSTSHYQLLVGPVLCLDKDMRCKSVERGLSRFTDR